MTLNTSSRMCMTCSRRSKVQLKGISPCSFRLDLKQVRAANVECMRLLGRMSKGPWYGGPYQMQRDQKLRLIRDTDIEGMAVINRPAERSSIVLAADREAVLAEAQPCIESHSHARQEHP